MSEQRKMLLIGAAGFAGAHLSKAAGEAGICVVPAGRAGGAEVPACDLLDPVAVSACVEAVKPDLVVNAAGSASVGRSWEHPAEAFAANATGVLNLLEVVARQAPAAHVLCLSSADVYGAGGEATPPLVESLAPQPLTPYGASKAAMEVVCGQYGRGRGLRVGVARAFNLIGPGQSGDFAVSGFARRVVTAEQTGAAAIELALGNPGAVRDFTDVRDAARALVELSRRELGGTYNLCSGRPVAISGLVEEMSRLTPVELTVRQDPGLERPADPAALVGDPSRLHEATGFAPQIPLSRTLADLLDWWRARLASA
jgi:GDP-4-dehydro-6-deoxy-D-mannose reductase